MIDFSCIRKDFPLLNKYERNNNEFIWFDNASTTLKPQFVIDAVTRYYKDESSNSKRGGYDLGLNVDKEIFDTRKTVANFINCNPNEVIFTSGTTESLNIVANLLSENLLCKGDEVIISEEEHASNVLPWMRLENRLGIKLIVLPLDENGLITEQSLNQIISEKTKIVSLAHISNVIGNILPIKELCRIAHEHNALFICDGAQSVPHIKVDVRELDVDFLAFSGHKMFGPTGVGVLYGKKEILDKLEPVKVGGGMNAFFNPNGEYKYVETPYKFEAGTLPIAGIYGLNAAIKYINSIDIKNISKHELELKKYATEKLESLDNIIVYNENSKSGIITFNMKDVESEDLETYLNKYGICVRSGQHCAKMLTKYLGTYSTLRLSLYVYNSKEEVDNFVNVLSKFDYDSYFEQLFGGVSL